MTRIQRTHKGIWTRFGTMHGRHEAPAPTAAIAPRAAEAALRHIHCTRSTRIGQVTLTPIRINRISHTRPRRQEMPYNAVG